jgi:hypothetical protein
VPLFNIFEVVPDWDNHQTQGAVEKAQIFGCSADLVAEHTRKCLTFDADIWSVFYGILVAIGGHFGWFYSALPVVLSSMDGSELHPPCTRCLPEEYSQALIDKQIWVYNTQLVLDRVVNCR